MLLTRITILHTLRRACYHYSRQDGGGGGGGGWAF